MGELGYCLTIISSILTILRCDGASERNNNRVEEAKAAVSSRADELQAAAALNVDNLLILGAADIDISSSNESTPDKCPINQTFNLMPPNLSKREISQEDVLYNVLQNFLANSV